MASSLYSEYAPFSAEDIRNQIAAASGASASAEAAKRGIKPYVYYVGLASALAGLIMGYEIGGSGGTYVMDPFRSHFDWVLLEDDEQDDPNYRGEAWITAAFSLGAMAGALPSGFIADRFGRRICLMVYCAVFTIGSAIVFTPGSIGQLYAGRVVSGLGVGGLSMCAPMYQAEMAPARIRGVIVTLNQLLITFGIALAACLNVAVADRKSGWRFSYGLNGAFSVLLLVLLVVFLPESPRWLAANGYPEAARAVLSKLHHPEEVEGVAVTIEEAVEYEDHVETGKWSDLWSHNQCMRLRSTAAIGALVLQQIGGINVIMYFAPQIFKVMFGNANSLVVNMVLMLVNFLATFIAFAGVETVGRRTLLIYGAIGMFVASGILGILAIPTFDYSSNKSVAYAMVAMTCLFIVNFAYSWGPMAWLVSSEVFPLRLRGKGMSVATSANWAANTVIGALTPFFLHGLNTYGTFVLLCVMNIVAFFLTTQVIPETRGTTLEDVEGVFLYLNTVPPKERRTRRQWNMSTAAAKALQAERHRRLVARLTADLSLEGSECSGVPGQQYQARSSAVGRASASSWQHTGSITSMIQ